MKKEPVRVVFRRYKDGEVVALFPEVPFDIKGEFCSAYARQGQHCSADYLGVIKDTRPATEAEYKAIKRELERAPYKYDLKVILRSTPKHHAVRRKLANARRK